MKKEMALAAIALGVAVALSLLGFCKPAEPEETADEMFFKMLPAEEALEYAKKSGMVVMAYGSLEEGVIAGKEVWNDFYKKTIEGKPASVLCAEYFELDREHMSEEYYEEVKDQYPCLFFKLLEFDGEEFRLRVRFSDKKELDSDGTYHYLLHLPHQLPKFAAYAYADEYFLVDDPSLTYEQIEKSMFSANFDDWVTFRNVYNDYMNEPDDSWFN